MNAKSLRRSAYLFGKYHQFSADIIDHFLARIINIGIFYSVQSQAILQYLICNISCI